MARSLDGIEKAANLPKAERAIIAELVSIFYEHQKSNAKRTRYYEQRVTAGECNLGIALPNGILGLEVSCCWPEKAVTALRDRSVFDGFVSQSGDTLPELDRIVRYNSLTAQYGMSVDDELKHGGVLCTLSRNDATGCSVRFHTFESSACRWNGVLQRIDAAFAIIDSRKYNNDKDYKPSVVNLYTEDATWVLTRNEFNRWAARRTENGLGRVSAELMRHQPSNTKPCGTSRISNAVMTLTRGYIRTITLATVGLEFSTAPQKYLLGVSDDAYDALINMKFKRYVDSILMATSDPNTGQVPQYGQLAQGSLTPHVDMLRMLSTQFAAVSSLSVTDVGVVNDANPTSADAVTAANEKLIRKAEDLNAFNGESMRQIGMMALAISRNRSLDQLQDEDKAIMAHFLNPSMPSMAATADAATKIASADPGFAGTDVYYEMLGFDAATIARIQAQKRRNRGLDAMSMFAEA